MMTYDDNDLGGEAPCLMPLFDEQGQVSNGEGARMTGVSRRDRLLAETGWLAAHLDDPQVRVVDMCGYVRTVDLGDGRQVSTYAGAAKDYTAGHIPNAIYLDWTRDIVDPDDPVPVQVAPPERLTFRHVAVAR